MANNLPFNKQVVLHAAFKDVAGNPATLTGISVSSSDLTILTVAQISSTTGEATNGEDFLLVPVGLLGSATITVSGTNSEGVVINATIVVDVVADAAASITLTLDTPVAIPAPVAPTTEAAPAV